MTEETGTPTVAALAREVGITTSEMLERCDALGIEVDWGGAHLSDADAARLRAMVGDRPAGKPTVAGAVPPTVASASGTGGGSPAVASPSVALGEAAEEQAADAGSRPVTFAGARYATDRDDVSPDPVPKATARVDSSIRPALIAGALAIVALIASDLVGSVAIMFLLWLFALLTAVIAVVSGNRARRRITLFPDKHRGLELALGGLGMGAVALLAIAFGTFTIVRSAPASDLPLGLGDRPSVNELRWSYQRLRLVQENGWHRPVADAGTCFMHQRGTDVSSVLSRSEIAELKRVSCGQEHSHEILAVYMVDPEADSAYDLNGILDEATQRCEAQFPELDPARLAYELADEQQWSRADHDVACHYVGERRGSVLDDAADEDG